MSDHDEDDDAAPTMRFTPIFDSYFTGSLMGEAVPTRYLYGWLIAQAQKPGANGTVDVPKSHIARTLNMSRKDVEEAIERLMAPDPESRCPDEDGRRLVPLDPDRPERGWRLPAAMSYRRELHNALASKRMQRLRARRGESVPDVPTGSETFPSVPERSHDTRRDDTRRDEKKTKTPLTPRKRGARIGRDKRRAEQDLPREREIRRSFTGSSDPTKADEAVRLDLGYVPSQRLAQLHDDDDEGGPF